MANVNPSAIDELLALGADPSIISFGGGYPDASLFPKQMLNQVFNEIINDPTGSTCNMPLLMGCQLCEKKLQP